MMHVQFHVLASGSSGNACVLETGTFGVLIDFGLPPKQLEKRMHRCRIGWDNIHAVLLTHEHSDHWQPAALTQFAKRGLPVYCHEDHVPILDGNRRAFAALSAAGLIRHYQPGQRLILHKSCACVPITLEHDCAMTCGFRIEGADWAIAYATDLGCWQPALARQLADVDLLALEFNHDVPMQLASRRHPMLIRRVLSDVGHLSNDQAASMLQAILEHSAPGRLKHVVQLHLSDECNEPDLACAAADDVLQACAADAAIHTTQQGRAGPSIVLGEKRPRRVMGKRRPKAFSQPLLPFDVG